MKKILLVLTAFVASTFVYAQDLVKIQDFKGVSNAIFAYDEEEEEITSTAHFSLAVVSNKDYKAMDFEIYVPEAITLDVDYCYDATNSCMPKTKQGALRHTVQMVKKNSSMPGYNCYKFLIADSQLKYSINTAGEEENLLDIYYSSKTLEACPVYVKNICMSVTSTDMTEVESVESAMTVADPTGINGIEAENGNAVAYDMTGRRVNANAKGVKVINGKKVIK